LPCTISDGIPGGGVTAVKKEGMRERIEAEKSNEWIYI